jgi:hypothetical protein
MWHSCMYEKFNLIIVMGFSLYNYRGYIVNVTASVNKQSKNSVEARALISTTIRNYK